MSCNTKSKGVALAHRMSDSISSKDQNDVGLFLRSVIRGEASSVALDETLAKAVVDAACFHGIGKFLFDWFKGNGGSAEIREESLEKLRHYNRESALKVLKLAGEAVRLSKRLKQLGVDHCVIKGPAVALLYYPELSHRDFCDLDLVVKLHDLERVRKCMTAMGYLPEVDLKDAALKEWYRENIEFNYQDLERGMHVEFHWGILPSRNSFDLGSDLVLKECRPVDFFQAEVEVPTDAMHLLILSAHACKHAWSRLIWLKDIEYLLNSCRDLDWEQTEELAASVGGVRMLRLAVYLARNLTGAYVNPRWGQVLDGDRKVRRLAEDAEEWMFNDGSKVSLKKKMAKKLFLYRCRERFQDRLRMTKWFVGWVLRPNDQDRSVVKLPSFLAFSYWLIRPVRLFFTYVFGGKGKGKDYRPF